MILQELPFDFTVCKLASAQDAFPLPKKEYFFLSITDGEVSLVCQTPFVPVGTTEREDGWKGFRVEGTLDFSLVGILSKISSVLAENGIPIFAISTYDTDYFFVKKVFFLPRKTLSRKPVTTYGSGLIDDPFVFTRRSLR